LFAQLVLLQLLDVHEQQLDVEQLEQLDVLVLLLHASVMDTSRSAMSSISNVSLASARSSSVRAIGVPFGRRVKRRGKGGSKAVRLVAVREAHGPWALGQGR